MSASRWPFAAAGVRFWTLRFFQIDLLDIALWPWIGVGSHLVYGVGSLSTFWPESDWINSDSHFDFLGCDTTPTVSAGQRALKRGVVCFDYLAIIIHIASVLQFVLQSTPSRNNWYS